MIDIDMGAYQADVIEHVLVGRARARMLEDVRAKKAWNVDLATGELTIGDAKHKAQILGTFANESSTFLWAWANPGAPGWTASLEVVKTLQQKGAQPGYAVLGLAELSADLVNPNEIAFVAAELAGGHPVFVGQYGGGAAFLLVTSLKMDIQRLPVAYIPGILLDLPTITTADQQRCVRRFAERLGFAVFNEGVSILNGTRSDGGFSVVFDDQHRIVEVSLLAKGRTSRPPPSSRPPMPD
jgi:hypothetical protein